MNPPDLLNNKGSAVEISQRAVIAARYKQLRAVGRSLHSKLIKRLPKDVIDEGARKLDLLHRGVLVLDTEEELSVLMDYCIYDVRRNGRNAVEQYLIDSAPDPESDEMVCLRAMQHAIYSVVFVQSVHAGLGATVCDLVSNQTLLLADFGIGASARRGVVYATRLLLLEDFAMTCGAGLPVGIADDGKRAAIAKQLSKLLAPDKQGIVDPGPVIRMCLSQGSSSRVLYQDPSESVVRPPVVSPNPRAAKVGRNDLCPCGSGKKFKRCCMKF